MRFCSLMFALFLLAGFASSTHAVTVYVPDDFATIQGAIDQCTDGDSVMVGSGTYVENIDFLGKAIVVKSESGPDVTVIDGSNPVNPDFGSVVAFISGEGASSVLDGFTLTNGSGTVDWLFLGTSGGGVIVYQSSPTILNCIITGNSATYGGGGIHAWTSSPTIRSCTITENQALFSGGVYCGRGEMTLEDNVIRNNSSSSYGGGVYCLDSHSLVMGNEITGNITYYGGGGIFSSLNDSSKIVGNVIRENSVIYVGPPEDGGGGIGVWESTPEILANVISENFSAGKGGGIVCAEPTNAWIEGNIITANIANDQGGGLYIHRSDVTVVNNTISGNVATNKGGGISCYDSEVSIVNSILWNNQASVGAEGWLGEDTSPSILSISYSDVEGGQNGIYTDEGSTLNWGEGMIEANPVFVTFSGFDYILRRGSPCIDSGDPALDDGIHWPYWYNNGSRSDMGAYGGPGNMNWRQ